jgi:hypothetical protein
MRRSQRERFPPLQLARILSGYATILGIARFGAASKLWQPKRLAACN